MQTAEDLTTTELLQKLKRLGLSVTAQQLRADVHAGYLLRPPKFSRGRGRGVGAQWSNAAVRRAEYLYRLRKLAVRGNVLRVLLFVRDGSGFDRVQPLAQIGQDKLLALVLSPVMRHHRRPPTRAEAEFMLETYEEHVPNPDPKLDGAAWGLLLYGSPLGDGSFDRLAQILERLEYPHAHLVRDLAPMWEQLDFSANRLRDAARDRSPERWAAAAECTRVQIARLRRWINGKARGVPRGTGALRWSTNPLSGFGIPDLLDEMLRELPGRITRSQLLAGVIPLAVLLHEWIDDDTFAHLVLPDGLRALE